MKLEAEENMFLEWQKVLPGGSELLGVPETGILSWKVPVEVWEMLQMGNFDFHFSSLCMKVEAEENAFVLMV